MTDIIDKPRSGVDSKPFFRYFIRNVNTNNRGVELAERLVESFDRIGVKMGTQDADDTTNGGIHTSGNKIEIILYLEDELAGKPDSCAGRHQGDFEVADPFPTITQIDKAIDDALDSSVPRKIFPPQRPRDPVAPD